MPQLDTIHILLIFSWTWLSLHLMMQKVKSLSLTNPMICLTPNKPMFTLPWL
uniref:ATP synthase F0 subunit 8 n=1 Tax=Oligodon chinensis TaxID=928511 RepID=A0A7G9UAN3_9SAUR|nr:ATP synthase F0 subunit 8 [Oligodon chinensis]QNN90164.1 ATP synthase F0 subunit 8 [Oligodon chinensis]